MDVGEVVKGLRSALLADVALAALLGAADSFYLDFPATKPAFPCLILDPRQWNPQTRITSSGVYRPEWQLDVFAVDPYAATEIVTHLERHWSIPVERPEAIETVHYRITRLAFRNLINVGPYRVVATGEQVRQWACEIALKVVERTGGRSESSSSGS